METILTPATRFDAGAVTSIVRETNGLSIPFGHTTFGDAKSLFPFSFTFVSFASFVLTLDKSRPGQCQP